MGEDQCLLLHSLHELVEEGASPHTPLLPYVVLHDDEIPVVQRVSSQLDKNPYANLELELASAAKEASEETMVPRKAKGFGGSSQVLLRLNPPRYLLLHQLACQK
jgi:hypothetical protein